MRKIISILIAFALVLSAGSGIAEAKKRSGGGFSSSKSSISVKKPKSSIFGSKSPKKSSSQKKTSVSTAKKKKKKAKTSVPSFTPPDSIVKGKKYNGRDVFMTAAGAYVIYKASGLLDDCDYDDIMEGDDDCEETYLSDSQLKEIGIDPPERKPVDMSFILFIVIGLILLVAIVTVFTVLAKRK
jgi:hypothetical protein